MTLLRTLCDKVPPGRVQRVIRSPSSDILAVYLSSVVLVSERRPNVLVVKRREGVDVRKPRMRVQDVKVLINE